MKIDLPGRIAGLSKKIVKNRHESATIDTGISRLFPTQKGAETMWSKRRDNRNRILRSGESQRKDGRYAYKYTNTLSEIP